MKTRLKSIQVFAGFLMLAACERNPVNRLSDPLADGVVPQSSGTYMIYDEELETGGGLGLIPGSGNQNITLADTSEPRRTLRQIRYTWNGQDVFNPDTMTVEHDFAGFSLLVSPDFTTITSASAKDLSSPGYTTLKMAVRGSLTANTKLRIEGPNTDPPTFTSPILELDSSQLTGEWQDVSLAIPANHFSSVKAFVTISFQYTQPPRTTNPGDGGVVYLDDIRYVR
jgi:hypothetical protein